MFTKQDSNRRDLCTVSMLGPVASVSCELRAGQAVVVQKMTVVIVIKDAENEAGRYLISV